MLVIPKPSNPLPLLVLTHSQLNDFNSIDRYRQMLYAVQDRPKSKPMPLNSPAPVLALALYPPSLLVFLAPALTRGVLIYTRI